MSALAWMDRAACQDSHVDLFFPTKGEANTAARTICQQCPVVDECAEYAISDPEVYGIWGDTTDTDRAQIRAMRNHPTTPRRHPR